MHLLMFNYDKRNGETPRIRFLGTNNPTSGDVFGVDLEDKNYKTFSKSKITNLINLGVYDLDVLFDATILNREQVFDLLEWNKYHREVFNILAASDDALANIVNVSKKYNIKNIAPGYFLQFKNNKWIKIDGGKRYFYMKVCSANPAIEQTILNKIEYYDENRSRITESEFIKGILQ